MSEKKSVLESENVCPYCHKKGVKPKRINPGKGYVEIGKHLYKCPICDSVIEV